MYLRMGNSYSFSWPAEDELHDLLVGLYFHAAELWWYEGHAKAALMKNRESRRRQRQQQFLIGVKPQRTFILYPVFYIRLRCDGLIAREMTPHRRSRCRRLHTTRTDLHPVRPACLKGINNIIGSFRDLRTKGPGNCWQDIG